jgi:L-lactate dehydrogenase complex protein LldG
MSARERILARIKEATLKATEKPVAKPDLHSQIYVKPENEDIAVTFAENFKKNKSEFFFFENIESFLAGLKAFVKERNLQYLSVKEKYMIELLKIADINFTNEEAGLSIAEAGLTLCEFLLARTGSILISSKQEAGRSLGIYPPMHIIVAFTSQIVADVKEGMASLQVKYQSGFPSMISVISGPSQTADIEKTLVLGAHGPKELILFLIDDLNDNAAA